MAEVTGALGQATTALMEYQARESADGKLQASRSNARDRWLILVAIAVGLCVSTIAALWLTRSITKSLDIAVKVADEIGHGRLGHKLVVSGSDELAQLLRGLHSMDGKLSEVCGEVSVAARSVGEAAAQLSQGNDDLSHRTQSQASALEETAASMEEMNATVKQNADNAKQAAQLATAARGQAETGASVVKRAINAMGEINDSSRKIADIIAVIDEIAFQTNLLALNAAVEAARAGEQGRGFAVVATEVRSLAQRSATAAKEIKDLISDSVQKVSAGSELVNESGQTLLAIEESVKKVSDIIAEIAAASSEQAAGVDQVNQAVTQMDEGTQQNAALVEEAAAASKALQQQAEELIRTVSFFTQSGGNPPIRSAPLATPVRATKVASVASKAVRKPEAKPAPTQKKVSGGEAWEEF